MTSLENIASKYQNVFSLAIVVSIAWFGATISTKMTDGIDRVSQDVTNLKGETKDLRRDVEAIKLDITDLKTRMNYINEDILEIKTDIKEMKSGISELKSDMKLLVKKGL